MKTVMSVLIAVVISGFAFGQKQAKVETVVIQTSAECEMCEERIENGLNYMKGVVFAELDLKTMKVTVKYKTKITSTSAIKAKIASIGYQADDLAAEEKALDALPACCKPNGGSQH